MQSESFKKRSLIYHQFKGGGTTRVWENLKIYHDWYMNINESFNSWNLSSFCWKGRTTKISVGPSAQLELQATGDAILGKVGDHCNEVGVWKILERMLFFRGRFGRYHKFCDFFVDSLLEFDKSHSKKELVDIGFQGNFADYFEIWRSHQQNNQKNCLNFWLLKWR